MLASDGAILLFNTGSPNAGVGLRSSGHAAERKDPAEQRILQIKFLHGNTSVPLEGEKELPGKVNYLVGSSPEKWKTNIPVYERVRYRGVYPGVDVAFHGASRNLEYDFLIAAGADPKRIALEYGRGTRLSTDHEGNLVIDVAGVIIVQAAPHAYQDFTSGRKIVASRYRIESPRQVGFELGAYDATQPLVIDPVLRLSTFLGGGNTDSGLAIARDPSGKIYAVGETASWNFPVTAGAFDTRCADDWTVECWEDFPYGYSPSPHYYLDAFVAKVDPLAPAAIYITYLGGEEEDRALGVAVDGLGSAYVVGSTRALGFPGVVWPPDDDCGGLGVRTYCPVGFLVKLNSTGSGIVYSRTPLGDGQVNNVALDANLNAYVLSWNGVGSNVYRVDPSGGPLAGGYFLRSSTFNGIAIDPLDGSVYVVGQTSWGGNATSGAFDTTINSTIDAFVAKLPSTLGSPVYFTYLGGRDEDIAYDVAINPDGVAFVTGATRSPDFPVDPSAWQPTIVGTGCNPTGYCFDAFVTILNSAGSSILYSTYLGGSRKDWGYGISFRGPSSAFRCSSQYPISNRFYLTGRTFSTDMRVINPVQSARGGEPGASTSDAFVAEFHQVTDRATGQCSLVSEFLSYFGGSGDDGGSDIVVDGTNIYLTGTTSSADFPSLNRFIPGTGDLGDAFLVHLGNPLPAYTGGSFSFDSGTGQNWRLEGAFDENGGGPYVSNFVNGWSDGFDYPTWPGGSPIGDGEGSLRLFTPQDHGIRDLGGSFWIMRFLSPDLSASPAWQSAAGFVVKIANTIPSTTPLYANLFVRVFDVDQARDRFFYNGTARALQQDQWDGHSFQWSTGSTFPVNHIIREVFVNIWGPRSTDGLSGELFLDEVQIITDLDGDRFASNVDCNDNNPKVYPGAPQLCDGLNNDCNDPSYPDVPPSETDGDGDGRISCADNCSLRFNPDQRDSDGDGAGDVCDACPAVTMNLCDPVKTASGSMGPGGGSLRTPDGSVTLIVPAGALSQETSLSITGTGAEFELMTDQGQGFALFGVTILPDGLMFGVPVTLILTWPDMDDDGRVDGTSVRESTLQVSKNGVALANRCGQHNDPLRMPYCDSVGNRFSVQLTSLSQLALFVLVEPAGAVPDGSGVSGTPLSIETVGEGAVRLSWQVSCVESDTDYEVYMGTIGDFTSHKPALCSTGGITTVTLDAAPQSTYYLLVPRNAAREGSYGQTSGGMERPVSSLTCKLQATHGCPKGTK